MSILICTYASFGHDDAAKKAGVVAPPGTFGFHTFRRTLASVLVKMKVDVKTVQEILRHQNLQTTLEIYARSMSEDRLLAQGMFLELLFSHKKPELPNGIVIQQMARTAGKLPVI
jgi:integrase